MKIMESSFNVEGSLSNNLEKVVVEYCGTVGSVEKRQALLTFLQNNDCREVVAERVDGDNVAYAFAQAAIWNHVDILKELLNRGLNVNIENEFGWTALLCACDCGNEESAVLLLQNNANVDFQDSSGWTALISASNWDRKNIVQLLLDHNADVDLKNNEGKTALDVAKTGEFKEMLQNHVNTSYVLK